MFQMIQALERRMLMSVTADTLTADVQTVYADARVAAVANSAYLATIHHDIVAIAAGLRHADTKANRFENNKLLAALEHNGTFYNAKVAAGVNGLLATAKYVAVVGAANGKYLLKHPTSAAYQKFLANDVAYANANVPAWLNDVEAELIDSSNAIATDLDLIADLNPTVSTAVSSFESDLATKPTALVTAAAQVQTDTTQLTSDLGAIPT